MSESTPRDYARTPELRRYATGLFARRQTEVKPDVSPEQQEVPGNHVPGEGGNPDPEASRTDLRDFTRHLFDH